MKLTKSIILSLLPVLRNLRVAGCFCSFLLCFNLSAGTRIAIVSENSKKLPDLLTAELSSVDGVELLDRGDISKVLKEHKISAQMLDSKQALKLNKLLKTDLFVVLESEKKSKKPIGLVVFDANTGVRYWDSALPEGDIDKTANFAAAAVKKALGKKQKAIDGKLKYISLLGVRNSDLPRDKDPFCQAVGIILMRQIGNSPDIVVLERDYLDYVTKERGLGIEKFVNQLKNSSMILDLEISRGDVKRDPKPDARDPKREKNVKCSVFVQENKVLTVNGSLDDSAKLANRLAVKLAEYLRTSLGNIVKIDKKGESRRLLREYSFLKGRGKEDEAYVKIAAWHALNPERKSEKYLWALIDAGKPFKYDVENINESLDKLEYAFELAKKWSQSCSSIHDYTLWIARDEKYSDQTRERAFSLLLRDAELRKLRLERKYSVKLDSEVKDFETYKEYCKLIRAYLVGTSISYAPFWETQILPLYRRWLDEGERYFKSGNGTDENLFPQIGTYMADELVRIIYRELNNYNSHKLPEKQTKQIQELFKRMLNHPIIPLRIYGKCGVIMMERLGKKNDPEYWKNAIKEISEFTKEQLTELGNDKRYLREKAMCYYTASSIINANLVGTNDYDNMGSLLYDFMVSRNELVFSIARESLNPLKVIDWSNNRHKMTDSEIKTIIKRAKELPKMVDKKNKKVILLSSRHIMEQIISGANFALTNIYKKRPDLKEDGIKWDVAKKLERVYAQLRQNSTIFFIALSSNSYELNVLSLKDMTVNKISEFELKRHKLFGSGRWFEDPVAVNKDYFIWGTDSEGLCIIPLNGQKPLQLDSTKGLASNYIQALTIVGNNIYFVAGFTDDHKNIEESYFYAYNLKDKKLNLIAASGRKTKETPFDDLETPVCVRGMFADPKKERILFAVGGMHSFWRMRGIWEYKYKENKWKKICSLGNRIDSFEYKNGKYFLISDWSDYYEFDIEKGKASLVFTKKKKKGKVKYPTLVGNHKVRAPFLLTKSYFWHGRVDTCKLFGRINIKTGKHEILDSLGETAGYFYLEISEDKRYLIKKDPRRHLYIVNYKENKQ